MFCYKTQSVNIYLFIYLIFNAQDIDVIRFTRVDNKHDYAQITSTPSILQTASALAKQKFTQMSCFQTFFC